WPNTGLESDALIAMKNEGGNKAVVFLSGVETLRFEFSQDAGDFDYIALAPFEDDPGPWISASFTGGIRFKGELQSLEALPGNFTPVAGATSPYFPPPDKPQLFFRVR